MRNIALATAALLALGFANHTLAQNNAAVEEIVVTGSFLNRPENRPIPVTVLGADDLAAEMKSNTAEILKDLSITQGSLVFSDAQDSGQSATSSINLRGVGPRATLVLLNGRRQTPDATASSEGAVAVDVNRLVPNIMVERVEILADGASALYGSDAVAGVVNFITKSNYEGFGFSARGQQYDRSGANEYEFGLIAGGGNDTTHLVAGLNYAYTPLVLTEEVFDDQRLIDVGTLSTFGNPGSFSANAPGSPVPSRTPDPLCADPSIGGPGIGGIREADRCALPLGFGRTLIAEAERYVGLVQIQHEFSESLKLDLEFGFADETKVRSSYGFPVNGSPNAVVRAGNPGFDDAVANGFTLRNDPTGANMANGLRIWYRLRNPANATLASTYNSQQFRVAGTLAGMFNETWDWQLTSALSDHTTDVVTGDTLQDRFQQALDCQGGNNGNLCYNPFASALTAAPGSALANSPEVEKYVFAERFTDGRSRLVTLEGIVRGSFGEIGGEPIATAFGYQHRHQDFSQDFDPLQNAGAFAFFNIPFVDFEGSRGVDAVFAEFGIYPTDALEVQLAGRYESYEGGLNTFDPKLSLLWKPRDNLFLRTSVGTSFRAPGELQTFGASITAANAGDINGITIDARAFTNGNLNLEAEEATTFTAGATWDVSQQLTLEFNFWSIQFENLIQEEDELLIVQADIADGTIDDPRIILAPGASNLVANITGNDIARINKSFINQESLDTQGLDFRADWSAMTDMGEIGLRLNGTYNLSYDISTELGEVDGVGQLNNSNFGVPIPAYMASLSGDWTSGNHYARLTLRHIPKMDEDLASNVATEEKAFTTLDLLYNYNWNSGPGEPWTLSLGVANLLDEDAPAQDDNLATANGLIHDPRGRMLRFAIAKDF